MGQKRGGSQLQFMQMIAGNKTSKAQLPEGTVITPALVAQHKTPSDCWTIFQGKAYDVTMYMDFHPGGQKELMKGAGKDCTKIVQKVHPWVSIEGLIGKLCLGPVVPDRKT